MANKRIAGITVEIGADTTKLGKALDGVEKNIRNTKSQLREVEKLLKLDPTNTELLSQKHKLLADAVKATKEKLETLKTAATQANDALARGDINQEQYDALQREIIKTEQELKNLQLEAKASSTALEKLGQAGEMLEKAGEKVADVGKKLTTHVTVPIAAAGTAAVKTAADFDSAMSKVAAVSGATGDDLEALRDKAREMGAKTKFSASEAAEAMNYMAMAGWKTNDMLNGIEGIMNLAAASGEDLATTSDIVTDALTAFGLTADDSAHFSDILAAASSNANTNVAMMGETFKYAAPVMGSMGYTAEDAAVAIGLMANSGIKASNAGTALRGILTNLASPSTNVANAMHKIGVSLDDGKGNMLSFRDVMIQLREGFGGLKISTEEFAKEETRVNQLFEEGKITKDQYNDQMNDLIMRAYGAEGALKADAAAAIGGKNAMAGLLAIVSASDEDFQKLINSVDNCDGSSLRMAETMQNNLGGQLTILKSQIQELAISFGEILMPTIREIVAKIQGLINKFNAMSPAMKETIAKVALIAAALGPLVVAVGKTIAGVGKVIQIIKTVKTAITVLHTVMLANPIALIVAAIAGLVVAFVTLWKKSEAFRNFWINLWESIKSAVKPVIDFIADLFSGLWEGIKAIWEPVSKFFSDLWNGIVESVKPILSSIIEAFKNAWELIKVVWDLVKPYFEGIWENIKAIFAVVKPILKAYFQSAWEAIKLIWSVAVSYFKAIWESIKAVFSVVKTYFEGMFKTAWEAIKFVWNAVTGYFRAIWNTIAGIFSVVKNVLTGNWKEAWNGIKGIVNTWKAYFQGVWDSIKKVFGSVGSWFKNTFSAAFEAVKTVFSGWGKFFSGLWDNIKTTFTALGTKLGDAISGSIKAGINGIIESIESTINKGIGLINSAIGVINKIPKVNISEVPELSLPRLAKGGTFSNGSAIVAEAGPELLTLMNGKATVTPLTDSARNSALAGAGTGTRATNVYQTFNVHATISSDYDVRRLSQQLAALSKQTAYGIGRG